MRISDWSSDVCSSDLARPDVLRDRPRPHLPRGDYLMPTLRPYQQQLEDEIDAAWAGGARTVMAISPTGSGKCLGRGKHGRASCREVVCKYVSISVVAVSLKKKEQNTIKHN